MTFECTYTADDWIEAQASRDLAARPRVGARIHRLLRCVLGTGADGAGARVETLRARAGLLMIAGFAAMLIGSVYLGWRLSPFWLIATGFLLAVIVLLFAPYAPTLRARAIRRQFAAEPANAISVRLAFDESSFDFIADSWRCRVDWSAVRSVRETPNLFLLTDDEPNTFMLPKRAFADDAAREQFRSFVRDRIAATRRS